MTKQDNRMTELSDKLKALSHPNRLRIIQGLFGQAQNVTAIQTQLGIPQPSVSAHLSKLRTAGLIQGERHGQIIEYSVIDSDTTDIMRSFFKAQIG